jgi:hypothetical protein
MKSWKTSLGGIVAAVGIALRDNPKTAAYAPIFEGLGVFLIGMSARDNKVSSEQVGAGITPKP